MKYWHYKYRICISVFLLLERESLDLLVFRACQIYAVKSAIDTMRNKGQLCNATDAARLLSDGHRTAQLYCKPLSGRVLKWKRK